MYFSIRQIAAVIIVLTAITFTQAQDLYYDNGRQYYKDNNYYAAIEMLTGCVKHDVNNTGAHAMLIHSFILSDRADEGVAYYRKYLQTKKLSGAVKNKVAAQCHKIAGNAIKDEEWEQAKGAITVGMLFNASYKDLRALDKQVDAALADAAKAEKKEELAKSNYALGLKALDGKKYATAEANFRKAVKYDHRFKQLSADYLPVAKKEVEKGHLNTAVWYYRICLAFDPDNLDIHDAMISLLEKRDKTLLKTVYLGLKKSYPRSKPIAVDLPARYVKEGDLLKQNQDYKLALSKYNQAAFYNPAYKGLQKSIQECKDGIARLARQKEDRILAEKTYTKAEALFKRRKYKLAVPEFRKAVDLDPRMKARSVDWHKKGMNLIKGSKTRKKGAMYLRVAAALDMGNAEIQVPLMLTYVKVNYMTLLKQHCAVFAKEYPPATEVNQAVAKAITRVAEDLQKEGKFKLAINRYDIVSGFNPGYKGNSEKIAECEAELKKLAELEANRKKAKAHYDQARKSFFRSQYKAAMPKFRLALKTNPEYKDKAEPWEEIGDKAVQERKLTKGVNAYKVSLIMAPERKSVHRKLVNTWMRLKKGKTGVAVYYESLRVQHKDSKFYTRELPGFFMDEGETLQKEKQYAEAIRMYTAAQQLSPDTKNATERIAVCRKELEITEALEKSASAYKKAMLAVQNGQFSTAAKLFDTAARLNPDYGNYLERLRKEGLDEFKDKKYQSASKKLGMVISKNIKDVDLHKDLIEAGIKSGNMNYLFKLYEDITVDYPFEETLRKVLPDYYYEQAVRHQQEGKYKRAVLEFEVVKMLKPGYKDVDSRLKAVRKKAK